MGDTHDVAAAREALASADTVIPESAPWWELVCHREHGQGRYDSEEEATADLHHGFPCDRHDCHYIPSRVTRVQVAARPRSQIVYADHLRATLAVLDAVTADLAALRIEHDAHAALLSATRWERDDARTEARTLRAMAVEAMATRVPT